MKRYAGKTVWIFGADTELGSAAARLFENEGARLLCPARDPQSDEEARALLADGTPDALVLIQRRARRVSIEACATEAWDAEIASCLLPAFILTRVVGRAMAEKRSGAIVYLSTIHDEKPTGCRFLYSVCAGGIQMMMRESALEYGRFGVRVNMVETGGLKDDEAEMESDLMPLYHTMETKIPCGRAALPEELAAPALFLCSDEASFVNGATLRADGSLLGYYIDGDPEARWNYGRS